MKFLIIIFRYRRLLEEKRIEEEKAKQAQIDDLRSSNSDEGILTKGSSGEELDDVGRSPRRDSSLVNLYM